MISIMSSWQQSFDGAPVRSIDEGATLFRREDPVRSIYLVRSGQIALERPLADGTTLTLHIASAGMMLVEASIFADAYHCDAVVRERAVIACMPRSAFLASLRESPDSALALINANAREIQSQRARIEILRLRRVADRLDAWLDLYGEPAKGEWIRVANAIGVSQPALYRELALRRKH
ncbi:Crp/Fnr family transcriptional regulator [Rhodobacter sp. NTK016B]|nr:Crp/Fnr family transcriptional regulator [Rhodobacter sp. NTK016B]